MKYKFHILIWISFLILFFGCKEKPQETPGQYWDILSARILGLSYLEENKLDEAEAEFLKLIELAPDEVMGYANLGLVYLRKGNHDDAKRQLDIALNKDPDNPDARLILAEYYKLTNNYQESINQLKNIIEIEPGNKRALYSLVELYSRTGSADDLQTTYLNSLVENYPNNIVPKMELIEILLKKEGADQALLHLEQIQQQFPEFPKEAAGFYNKALEYLHASNASEALKVVKIMHNFLKVTTLYQSDLRDIAGPGGAMVGYPVITFSQLFTAEIPEGKSIIDAIFFTEVTSSEGLDAVNQKLTINRQAMDYYSYLAVGDYDGDGDQDIYFSNFKEGQKANFYLLRNEFAGRGGLFEDVINNSGIDHSGEEYSSIFADYDNDGWLDLYIVKNGANLLYKNNGEGGFVAVTLNSKAGDQGIGSIPLFFDIDHDGDLDLFITGQGTNLLYRNNSDGTFLEQSELMGVAGDEIKSRDAAFGDFDEDGDIDLLVINENAANILYSNQRQGRFENITKAVGLGSDGNSGAVAVGDYNNDGFLDFFITALESGSHRLLKNNGDGSFKEDNRKDGWKDKINNLIGHDAEFFDFDNDGFLDLLIVGKSTKRGVVLLHNDGSGDFEDVSHLLPENLTSGRQIKAVDYDEDGDLDFFIAGFDGSIRLFQNNGGNLNHYLKVNLVGLRTGSSKNNHFGIGSKLEIRAGDLYQMKVVTDPVVHFGLGDKLKADVVRILWTNGTPQNIFFPGSDQDLIEEQVLKGSCFFLYTWNGEEYTFVKDMMWRSALGMPLGIMGGTTTSYAFSGASKEYLKIPGELLKPKSGVYSIQITEELWETAYFDKAELYAIDHPDSVEIYVDERFVSPPYPEKHVYVITNKILPVSATDGKGNDLLSLITTKDDKFISNFKPAKYQGVTELKDLIMDFGDMPTDGKRAIFLNGWLYPTDASINISISQAEVTKLISPYMQVINQKGEWETVIENLGFPMGKNKTMVVEITGKFLSKDRKVRIRTNMEIYWDHIFISKIDENVPIISSKMKPISADLHYRGFSEMYRKGGRYGPHWFDYNKVSKSQKWRDLIGNYTRYGDVNPLLQKSDNKYIIANSGDEITIEFNEENLPELKNNWKRDFLIYSEGWIKDGDLNTAHGKTVGPLPFHQMSRYPYGNNEVIPANLDYQKYIKNYNTRKITTEEYIKAIIDLDK